MKLATTLLAAALTFVVPALLPRPAIAQPSQSASPDYTRLTQLFTAWRAFLIPATTAPPDYTPAAIATRTTTLASFQQRLHAIPTASLTPQQLTDYRLVQAELNGLDFDLRVLRPWARDPAFYATIVGQRSDTPLREGPYATPDVALYRFTWPLSPADAATLTAELRPIPALLTQARANLAAANARDLWVYGITELRNQLTTLQQLQAGTLVTSTVGRTQVASLAGTPPQLHPAAAEAQSATEAFIAWLDQQSPTRTGPSGVGIENYNWYQQNVHLVPYTWGQQVTLLRRELDRAQSSLLLEEHRNRNLPPLPDAQDKASFDRLVQSRVDTFLAFLVDQQIIPDKPYLKEVIRKQLVNDFVPPGQRTFFTEIIHREPMLLLSHDYHWIDLGRMRDEPYPSPIRSLASTSNLWDTRAEGFATAFEELVLHAGLYDANPRAKELVWIMLANRAARGLAALYVQANLINLQQAGDFHARWTPRSYAHASDTLTAFEQLLYLRQPGYGASYILGKLELDQLMTEYAATRRQAGQPFTLSGFLDTFNREGIVPIPLMEDELIPPAARDYLPLNQPPQN